MRHAVLLTVLLAGCNSQPPQPLPANTSDGSDMAEEQTAWDLQSSGEGAALVRTDGSIRLFCARQAGDLLVNVQAFRPVGSEERMSFGQGGEVVALVAGTSGDSARGGVSGQGPVPADLAALLSGPVSVSYGSQVSGPHPQPPSGLVTAFARSCSEGSGAAPGAPPGGGTPQPAPAGSPCLVQDGNPVPDNALRAVGTEPFWAAIVQGRCVTYSHPENQAGTRVWTKFSGSAENGTWTGSLEGKPFVMRTRPEAGCSDGMSDNRYPIAVSLTVGGEQRSGCAAPR